MARVFIGIPTYNRPDYVQETVESLLAQSFQDWRAIVSDNASPNTETTEAVRSYIEGINDDRISFYLQPSNEGEYGQGRYFSNQLDKEDYFAILHDDDTLHTDYLENGIKTLDQEKDASFYFSDPLIIDADGTPNPKNTEWYKDYHGRNLQKEGLIDVLSHHLTSGITPISATLFRAADLIRSGFVDDDMKGNFPFEINVFLRLGELPAQSYYAPRQEVAFRFHPGALRKDGLLMKNETIVRSMIQLFKKRKYEGHNESRRRIILSCCYRSLAVIESEKSQSKEVRPLLKLAFNTHRSLKNMVYHFLGQISPAFIRALSNISKNEIANPS